MKNLIFCVLLTIAVVEANLAARGRILSNRDEDYGSSSSDVAARLLQDPQARMLLKRMLNAELEDDEELDEPEKLKSRKSGKFLDDDDDDDMMFKSSRKKLKEYNDDLIENSRRYPMANYGMNNPYYGYGYGGWWRKNLENNLLEDDISGEDNRRLSVASDEDLKDCEGEECDAFEAKRRSGSMSSSQSGYQNADSSSYANNSPVGSNYGSQSSSSSGYQNSQSSTWDDAQPGYTASCTTGNCDYNSATGTGYGYPQGTVGVYPTTSTSNSYSSGSYYPAVTNTVLNSGSTGYYPTDLCPYVDFNDCVAHDGKKYCMVRRLGIADYLPGSPYLRRSSSKNKRRTSSKRKIPKSKRKIMKKKRMMGKKRSASKKRSVLTPKSKKRMGHPNERRYMYNNWMRPPMGYGYPSFWRRSELQPENEIFNQYIPTRKIGVPDSEDENIEFRMESTEYENTQPKGFPSRKTEIEPSEDEINQNIQNRKIINEIALRMESDFEQEPESENDNTESKFGYPLRKTVLDSDFQKDIGDKGSNNDEVGPNRRQYMHNYWMRPSMGYYPSFWRKTGSNLENDISNQNIPTRKIGTENSLEDEKLALRMTPDSESEENDSGESKFIPLRKLEGNIEQDNPKTELPTRKNKLNSDNLSDEKNNKLPTRRMNQKTPDNDEDDVDTQNINFETRKIGGDSKNENRRKRDISSGDVFQNDINYKSQPQRRNLITRKIGENSKIPKIFKRKKMKRTRKNQDDIANRIGFMENNNEFENEIPHFRTFEQNLPTRNNRASRKFMNFPNARIMNHKPTRRVLTDGVSMRNLKDFDKTQEKAYRRQILKNSRKKLVDQYNEINSPLRKTLNGLPTRKIGEPETPISRLGPKRKAFKAWWDLYNPQIRLIETGRSNDEYNTHDMVRIPMQD